jgi:hypothetical protein
MSSPFSLRPTIAIDVEIRQQLWRSMRISNKHSFNSIQLQGKKTNKLQKEYQIISYEEYDKIKHMHLVLDIKF